MTTVANFIASALLTGASVALAAPVSAETLFKSSDKRRDRGWAQRCRAKRLRRRRRRHRQGHRLKRLALAMAICSDAKGRRTNGCAATKDRRSCERLASGRALQATVQSAAARVSEPCLGFNSVASTRDDRLVSNFNPNNHVPPSCTILALGSFCQIGLPLSWV
jgi:hypothetical protein